MVNESLIAKWSEKLLISVSVNLTNVKSLVINYYKAEKKSFTSFLINSWVNNNHGVLCEIH